MTNIYIRKIQRNVRDYGLLISMKKGFFFLLKPIYEKKSFVLYQLDLEKKTSSGTGPHSEYTFRVVHSSDGDLIEKIEEMEEWLKGELKEKLMLNGICMVVLKNDEVAGFNLVSVGSGFIPLLKMKIITPQDEAWSEQISIDRKFRKMGLANQLRSLFYAELKKREIKALYGHRQEFNIASEKSAHKFTYKELCKVEYRKWLSYERLKYMTSVQNCQTEGRRSCKSEWSYLKPENTKKKAKFIVKVELLKNTKPPLNGSIL